jgi:hypothetical protein
MCSSPAILRLIIGSRPAAGSRWARLRAQRLRARVSEELGVTGRIDRLLWVSENFFKSDARFHQEAALYFLVELPDDAHADLSRSFERNETDGTPMTFAWHRLDELRNIRLVPLFLADALTHLPEHPEHIVYADPDIVPQDAQ